MKHAIFATLAALAMAGPGAAQVIISEVHPNGSSGGAAYAADWFELTNIGNAPVNISGWSMDDDSQVPGVAPLTGVTSLLPGQSAVFLNAASTQNSVFINSWFGSNPPPGFTIGNYTGSGVGLSTGGDQVWIFDSGNAPVTAVSFGANTTLTTFDNAAGIGGATPPTPPGISQLSSIGVNGAFVSFALVAGQPEIGSPGTIGAVPEPSSLAFAGIGAAAIWRCRRKKKRLS